ncbi:MAG: alkyl sulfatase dimerization domain-containing protein, partial [Nitratireductor sp.]
AHGIPGFGTEETIGSLMNHRDAYKFLHDQTIRLINTGLTATEIAEVLKLPDVLAKQWYNRGYYGTMSHNAKAIYQRYIGWYDANPANLNPLPPEPAAKRYVEAMGGQEAVKARAADAVKAGELRWAATLLNHAVFNDASDRAAREQLAGIYTKLGFEAEAGTWRNIYLTGAQELTDGVANLSPVAPNADVLSAMTTPMLLDIAAVRVNPAKAEGKNFMVNIRLTDRDEKHLVTVENGVLIHEEAQEDASAGATVTMTRAELVMTLLAGFPVADFLANGGIKAEGDTALYEALTGLIEAPKPNFNIVEP